MSNKDKGKEKDIEIIKKINDLYIMARYLYLILSEDGNYRTFNTKINKNAYPLTDYVIQRHLDGKATLGVFSSLESTKFICFDIDVKNGDMQKAKWITYKVRDALIEIGIPEDNIYTSFSGGKGYHIEIFFSKPISNELIYELYIATLHYADIPKSAEYEVEYRPNALKQGVKLPLGKNFKSKSNLRCWYVDWEKGLKKIQSKNYILQIVQIDSCLIEDLIDRERDRINIVDMINIENTKKYIDSHYVKLPIYDENSDEKITLKSIENLVENGLVSTGTRHKSIFKLGKFYRYLGYAENNCVEAITEWMAEQDRRMYTTSWEDCVKDIQSTIKYIYDNEITLTIDRVEFSVSYEEMDWIMKFKSINDKLLIYCLLIHSKRYATKSGSFYMTFKQMSETSGLAEKTVRNSINKMERSGMIEIVERNRINRGKDGKALLKKKPNVYKLNITQVASETSQLFIISNNETNYKSSFTTCILYFYDKKSLKGMLPRRQYEGIVRVKELVA